MNRKEVPPKMLAVLPIVPCVGLDMHSILKQTNEDQPENHTSPTLRLYSPLPLTGPPSSRSSHHSPASHGSSQSSLYLSPPVTDSEPENLPYKPGDDDTTSLNMHANRKGRKKATYRRKDQPATFEYANKAPDQLTLANGIRRRVSAAGSSKSFSSLSDDSGLCESKKIAQITTTITTAQRSHAKCGKTGIAIPIGRLDGKVLKDLHDYNTNTSRSYRSSGTERLSPGTTLDMTRRWSIVGDSVILNPPIATACAENLFEQHPLLSSHIGVEDSAMRKHKRKAASKVRNHAYRNGYRRRISPNDFKLETPATITLRKASNNYHREKTGSVLHNGTVRIPKRSTIEHSGATPLLLDECLVSPRQEANTIFSTAYRVQSEASVVSPASPRSCTLLSTSTSSSDRPLLKRRTIAVDPALTFAEVHTTPDVFSPGGASRKHSLLAIETMRRSSAVMVRSGSSIHEIIWDKDDAPSTSSSRRSLSQAESGNSSEARSLDESPRKTSTGYHRFRNPDFSKLASIDTEVSSVLEGVHTLREAAGQLWTTQQVDRDSENVTETPAVEDALEGKAPSRTKSKRGGRWSKSWGRNISTSTQGIESFPPLLERGSTFEWRKAPLVDINDPIAGRSNAVAPKTNTVGKKRGRVTEDAQDGTWTNGQPGTALGTSSHHRRPSAGPHQQGPYSSLVDLSKSVSRRASAISHSLSDKALELAATRHEPPPERHLSKSANHRSEKVKPFVNDNTEYKQYVFQGSYAAQRTAPVWRKNSNGGLRINTASMLPDSRVLRVAGLSEVAEDEGEYRAETR
ncbi:hypothetical protein MMC18_005055 [Xylographa bjoerkii]|nr:hypothetical protein [Xylographa bjoerkii]